MEIWDDGERPFKILQGFKIDVIVWKFMVSHPHFTPIFACFKIDVIVWK